MGICTPVNLFSLSDFFLFLSSLSSLFLHLFFSSRSSFLTLSKPSIPPSLLLHSLSLLLYPSPPSCITPEPPSLEHPRSNAWIMPLLRCPCKWSCGFYNPHIVSSPRGAVLHHGGPSPAVGVQSQGSFTLVMGVMVVCILSTVLISANTISLLLT